MFQTNYEMKISFKLYENSSIFDEIFCFRDTAEEFKQGTVL